MAILAIEQGITDLEGDVLKAINAKETKTRGAVNLDNTKNLLDSLILLANSQNLLKPLGDLQLD